MRQDYLVGSAVAVLLFGATAAIFLPRSGTPPGGKANTQMAAAPATQDRAGPGLVPQPAAPVAPSFDVIKVGPSGTAVIAGRAEPAEEL